MVTTKEDISNWFDEGLKDAKSPTHMIVMCDTYDYEDYPVYVYAPKTATEVVNERNGNNMQKVMEVYSLSMDKEEQLKTQRAYNLV